MMANGIVESQLLDDYHVSFESFHSGETPKTATDVTKFFPIDANEVLNTPTAVSKSLNSGGLFFSDDFQKRISVFDNSPSDEPSTINEEIKCIKSG